MFKVFKLDQTVLNSKEFDEARAFHKIKLTTKTGINHSSFEINQTLSSVIKQSGTHTRKIGIEQNQTF